MTLPVEPTPNPPSSPMRTAANVFLGLSLLPALLGLWLLVEDAKDSQDMFHGLGYFLGGIILGFCALTAVCFLVSKARKTFKAQAIWFFLAFSPPVIAILLTLISRALLSGSV